MSAKNGTRTDWRSSHPAMPAATEERIAQRVAELLGAATKQPIYLDTAGVAEMLGVEADYVRAHWRDLGGFRLPSEGGRGRLRFDPDAVRRKLTTTKSQPEATSTPSRISRTQNEGGQLLPIKGAKAS